MTILDLTKATVVCGGSSYLIYSYPVLGQIVVITVMAVLWLAYARAVVGRFRRM